MNKHFNSLCLSFNFIEEDSNFPIKLWLDIQRIDAASNTWQAGGGWTFQAAVGVYPFSGAQPNDDLDCSYIVLLPQNGLHYHIADFPCNNQYPIICSK